MASDLTVRNLCEAIRHFLQQIADHPELPVDRERGLVLHGTPGDDMMRDIMEAFGGELKITVRELPGELKSIQSIPGNPEAVTMWHPSEELKQRAEEFANSPLTMEGEPPADPEELKESTGQRRRHESLCTYLNIDPREHKPLPGGVRNVGIAPQPSCVVDPVTEKSSADSHFGGIITQWQPEAASVKSGDNGV